MTGPAVPSDEELRGLLAGALESHQFVGLIEACWTRCLCGWTSEEIGDDDDGSFARHEADILLPVVRRYVDQRGADALRAAAEIAHCGVDQRRLEYRANRLTRP